MRFWQRAITIIMLMVFAPASVLAGTPLRICTSSDGHRAIEFVLSADHHHTDDAVAMASPGASEMRAPTHCKDSPLLSSTQKPVRSAEKKFTPPSDDTPPASVLVTAIMLGIVQPQPDAKPFTPREADSVSSQLDAIKTVVLLI